MKTPVSSTRSRGFTIVEILIVIAIMVALIAITVPTFHRAKKNAGVLSTKGTMGAIQMGLQAYFAQFNQYPPSSNSQPYLGTSGRGSAMLAQGLEGYLPFDRDGAGPKLAAGGASPNPDDPTYGFRTRITANVQMRGKGDVFGPYVPVDSKVLKVNTNDQVFVDYWGNEILYFRSLRATTDPTLPPVAQIFNTAANLGANLPSSNNAYFVADDCLTLSDGSAAPNPMAAGPKFFPLISAGTMNNAPSGTLGADSYLLISAGPDGVFYTADDIVVGKQ